MLVGANLRAGVVVLKNSSHWQRQKSSFSKIFSTRGRGCLLSCLRRGLIGRVEFFILSNLSCNVHESDVIVQRALFVRTSRVL